MVDFEVAEGSRYRLRVGYVVEIVRDPPTRGGYAFTGFRVGTSDHFIWTGSGRYFAEGPDSPLDIVAVID